MKTLETHLRPKKAPAACEDGIVTTSHHAAVIDGSTSKTDQRIRPDVSNGRWTMLRISEFIRLMPPDITLGAFCRQLTAFIADRWRQETGRTTTLDRLPPQERPTASVIVYSPHHQQIWMVGDCQCLVDGQLYENNKPSEAANAEKRSRIARQLLDGGTTVAQLQQHDFARDEIIPDIIHSMKGQNRTYAVVDGTPVYMPGIRTADTSQAKEIVLASDGYPFLCPTLAESETRLQSLLRQDPLCIRLFKATKGIMAGNHSFDDRAYLRIST